MLGDVMRKERPEWEKVIKKLKITLNLPVFLCFFMQGLEDQLLGDVVRKERPELEESKDRLVVSISNDKRQLADLEDKVGCC